MSNPNWEVDLCQEYYLHGILTIEKLTELKDQAYEIDKLARQEKWKEWKEADTNFVTVNGSLGRYLLSNAQANSCPYAAKGQ
jgi:hypothetical protein